jgi:hypothetical protein
LSRLSEDTGGRFAELLLRKKKQDETWKPMLYMVIERFREGQAPAVYQRAREQGRMMPPGLTYVSSWVEPDFSRCFQVMECEDPDLLRQWMEAWEDLTEFEVVPVITSAEAAERMAGAPILP